MLFLDSQQPKISVTSETKTFLDDLFREIPQLRPLGKLEVVP